MNVTDLAERIGYTFQSQALLEEALTHPSQGYETRRKIPDNQRLEFLGDAVLQLTLTQHLYHAFSNFNEGLLTKLRAQVVNRPSLATMARELGLGEFLILGRGEAMNGGREKESNLADVMEALIGAMYLDAGFVFTSQWILKQAAKQLQEATQGIHSHNPKGELQELFQGKKLGTPEYQLIEESGPDHAKNYIVKVSLRAKELAVGSGKSKKAAEINAAAEALRKGIEGFTSCNKSDSQ